MKYTPLDIRHQEFSGALSGYSKREVREFLIALSDQAEDAERELRAALERVSALEAQVNDLRQGEETLRRAVVSAERIANELRANAEREAAVILREAEEGKDRLLREALQRARDVRVDLERARGERQIFLNQFRGMLQGYLASIDQAEQTVPS